MARFKYALPLDVQGDFFYKRCSKCRKWKPIDDFYSNGNGSVKSHCKPCKRAASRAYEMANAEVVAVKKSQRYRDKIEHYKAARKARYWKDPAKARRAASVWGKENREQANAQSLQWARNNPERSRAIKR